MTGPADAPAERPPRPPLAAVLVAALAGGSLAVHLAVTLVTPYGLHRDSLLYAAMGDHLRLWSMDFPPLIAILAVAARAVLGDTELALHVVPAIFGSALVVVAALLARELGGGRFAQGLAMLAVLTSPLFLRAASLFQPVVLDQLWWTIGFLALARIARDGEPGDWALLGVAGGLGLLTKFSIGFFGLAVAVALLATPLRRWYRTPWPWMAAALALLIGSPSVVGQIRLDFPVLTQMGDLRATQLERVTPAAFLVEQLLYGPGTLLALDGAAALFAWPRLRAFRALGWTAVGVLALLLALRGKAYYFGPVYPALFAAGAVGLEALPHGLPGRAARWGAVVLLLAYGALTLPLGLPFLPPEPMARYATALGVTSAVRTNRGEVGQLPQDYADMLGWEDQVRAVAEAWRALPADQREAAVILAGNYGEAGAIDFYGPRYGLPRAVSPVGSYWFFGPGDKPGRVALAVGIPPEELLEAYADVRVVDRFDHPWMVSEERDIPIVLATGGRRTLQEVWPSLAGMN